MEKQSVPELLLTGGKQNKLKVTLLSLGGLFFERRIILVARVVSPKPIFTAVKAPAFFSVEFVLKSPYTVCAVPNTSPNVAFDLWLSVLIRRTILNVVNVASTTEKTTVPSAYSLPLLKGPIPPNCKLFCPFENKVNVIKNKIYCRFVLSIKIGYN